MKPETLFQMMDEISPDYIAEAKPKNTRTRPGHAPARTQAKTAAEDEIFEVQQPVMQKRRKDNIMKSSMIQRFTTGMVAAAALAVFVGGGVFIAKQQKDKSAVTSSTPASQIAEQRPENFLGGTGAVHAMQSAERGGLAMYDDENFYFGGMTVPRSGALQENVTLQADHLSDILWDGDRFYRRDGGTLSLLDTDGTQTPFFDASQCNLSVPYPTDRNLITAIYHLSGDNYVIVMIPQKLQDGQVEASYGMAAVFYRADTGKIEILDDTNAMRWETLLRDGNGGFYVLPANDSDGETWVYHLIEEENSMTSIYSPAEKPITPGSMYLTPDNKTLYYRPKDSDELRKVSTSELTIRQTGSVNTEAVLEHVPADGCLAYDGTLFVFDPEQTQIERTDLEWNTQELLWRAVDDDNMPEKFRAAFDADGMQMLAVDENYLFVQFGTDAQFGLLDRKTREMRYITVTDTQEQTDEPQNAEDTAPPTEESNIYGGEGALRIVKPLWKYGGLLRDDRYFYYGGMKINADGNAEYGGISELPTVWNGHPVITDSEQLYTQENGKIWSLDAAGNETLFYEVPGVWMYNGDHSGYLEEHVSDIEVAVLRHIYDDVYVIAGTARTTDTNEACNFAYYIRHANFEETGSSDDCGYYCLPEHLVTMQDVNRLADLIPAPEKKGFYCYEASKGRIVFVPCHEDADWKVNRVVSPYTDQIHANSWTVKDGTLYYLNSEGEFCKHVISDDAVVYLDPNTGREYDTTDAEYAKNAEKTVLTAPEGTLRALYFGSSTVYALLNNDTVWAADLSEPEQWTEIFRNQDNNSDKKEVAAITGGVAADDRLLLMAVDGQDHQVFLQIFPDRPYAFALTT